MLYRRPDCEVNSRPPDRGAQAIAPINLDLLVGVTSILDYFICCSSKSKVAVLFVRLCGFNFNLFIHICSAGGGRTGTFLALLILCEQLDRCNEVNAVEALKKLRDGRTGMIENLVSNW